MSEDGPVTLQYSGLDCNRRGSFFNARQRARTEPRAIAMTRSLSVAAGLYLSAYATTTLAPSKGRLIRCTVPGSTPKRFA
jgi:hypothetical protein